MENCHSSARPPARTIPLGLVLAWLALLCLNACSTQEKPREYHFDEAFTPYISAYTSNTISRKAGIEVVLNQDVKGEPGTVLNENPFSFEPKIEGTARLVNTRTIAFEPVAPMPSNTYFKAQFKLQEFLPDLPSNMGDFEFNFETMQQTFHTDIEGLEALDDKNLKWQTLKGEVTMADFESDDVVEQLLSARHKGNAMKVKWIHSLDGLQHQFRIDSIQRKDAAGSVAVKWTGKALGLDLEGEESVTVPSLSEFKVTDVETFNDPEQSLKIKFSDPIKANQNLKGLIQVDDLDLRFAISGNVVEVFPRTRTFGELKLTVNPGIRNTANRKIKLAATFDVHFEDLKPQVRLVGKGSIIPRQSGVLPFAFETVNLKSVDLKIMRIYEDNVLQFLQANTLEGSAQLNRVGKNIHTSSVVLDKNPKASFRNWKRQVVDLSKFIDPEPGAIYRIELNFDMEDSAYPCDGVSEAQAADGDEEDEEDEYYYYGDSDYYERYRNRDNPCHEAYYTFQTRSVARNVLASDLGLMVKRGTDHSVTMVATDLHSTEPLGGVVMELFDFQQQSLGSYTTNGEGMVETKLKEAPFLMVAQHGAQKGYLKLQDGLALSMSKFDISGKSYNQGVKGFIYGERGVWRPGDTLYISFFLEDDLQTLPGDHPVNFTLTNPRGQVVRKESKTNHLNGVYTFQYATAETAPTGNYQLNVQVGGSSFNKTLKVETVIPNRLKIKIDYGKDFIVLGKEVPEVDLSVRWLHGAIAKNLQADVSVNLKQGKTQFKGLKGYQFDDPIRRYDSERLVIFDGQVDENGEAKIPLKISVGKDAPGVLQANFITKVFEPGGSFSTDRFSIPVYPYDEFVGVKIPKGKGYRGWLTTTEETEADIAVVDPYGKLGGNVTVEATLYRLDWRWWWDHSSGNITNYNQQFYRDKYDSQEIKLVNGKGKFKFQPPQWGRYLLQVSHPDGHSTGKVFYAEYPWWKQKKDEEGPGGATMLNFTSNKDAYEVGDDIVLNIPMGKGSRALVSLESGSTVLNTQWATPASGSATQIKFPATKAMAPNIYAHITLIQPHAHSSNDLPIRLYGVLPLKVTDPMTVLKPKIATTATFRPMEKAGLKVSEANGKAMTYTVAVVDEGLLDLTRFGTPDPWNTFYAREALDVKTWDLYDQVAGAYGADLTKLLGIGGGMGLGAKEGSKVNRFRPVVKFMGPFELKAGASATHSFNMPNYVGAVRTMVIARSGSAYGSAEKSTPVRKPLMVLGTLPRVLGPGEEVKLPVTVFAMEKHVKNVAIGLQAGDLFEVVGDQKLKLNFDRPGDQLATFSLKVKEQVGTSTIKVVAQSGSETAIYHIDVEVRNPNPPMKTVVEATLDDGSIWAQNYEFPGMKGTNSGILEVSRIPPMNLHGRLRYLIRYPHGCVEQTTSSVLPQLYLAELLDLPSYRKQEIDKNIRAGIKRLKRFQNGDGGLGYWPGATTNNEWGTNYAGRFLVEARKKGYRVPDEFFNKWLKFQKAASRRWTKAYSGGEIIQAERLYLLALAGSPELGPMNRMRETKGMSTASQWRLAAAYHLAGQPEMAGKIAKDLAQKIAPYRDYGYHYGSNYRDEALILECMVTLGMRSEAKNLSERVAKRMNSNSWMNTQETGFSLIAMARYTGQDVQKNEAFAFAYRFDGGDWKEVKTSKAISQIKVPLQKDFKGRLEFKKLSGQVAFTKLILEGTPVTGDQDASQNHLSMRLAYYDLEGERIDVDRMVQGTDFIAEVSITNQGDKGDLDELALSQIFPSGWEIHNSRLDGIDWGDDSAKPEYQDIRDDRIYTYFDLGDGINNGWWYWYGRQMEAKTKTFRVMLNASYLGKFYLPTAYVEAMYDATVNARIPGRWVEVIAPESI